MVNLPLSPAEQLSPYPAIGRICLKKVHHRSLSLIRIADFVGAATDSRPEQPHGVGVAALERGDTVASI